LGRVLLLDPAHISESYSTGKTLVCRTLEYLTLGDKNINKLKQTRSISTHFCLGCQVNTHFFLVKHLSIRSLQYSSNRSITPLKKKSGIFFTIILDLSHWIHLFALITLIHILFSANFFFLPRLPLFNSPILMAHTRSQDLEAHFNTLQTGLIETQQELKQLNVNVSAINTTMQSSMGEIKQDLTTQLESVFSAL
jgi:hypothetical protein